MHDPHDSSEGRRTNKRPQLTARGQWLSVAHGGASFLALLKLGGPTVLSRETGELQPSASPSGDSMMAGWMVAILSFSCLLVVALLCYLRVLGSSSVEDRWFEWLRRYLHPPAGSISATTVFQAVSGSDAALRTATIAGTYTLIAAVVAGGFALATKSLELSDNSANEASASLLASESFAQWRVSPFYRNDLPGVRSDAVAACGSPKDPIDATLSARVAHILFAASSFGCPVPKEPPADCGAVGAVLRGLTFCKDPDHD